MSFASDMLDGLPVMYKRVEGTTLVTHEVASFLNKIAVCRREYIAKMKGIVTNYAQHKLLAHPDLDGSLKTAVETLVSALDESLTFESTFTGHLAELSTEIEAFRRERDTRRKKLQADGDALLKDLANQMEICRKTKANYMSLSREADKQQAALVKASSDPSIKTGRLAQMSTKTSMAVEKARAAEQEYRDIVRATNEKQTSVYTREMPALLLEYQNFEEERIRFLQERLKRYGSHVLEWPDVFSQAGKRCSETAAAINVANDITSWVGTNKTSKGVPPAIEVELYSSGHPGGVPATPSIASGSSSTSLTGSSSSSGGAASGTPERWGLGPEDKDLSEAQKRTKLEGQLKKLETLIKADENGVAALERMSAAYANDPVARKKAEGERADFERRINEAKENRDRVSQQLKELGSAPAEAPASAPAPKSTPRKAAEPKTAPAPPAESGGAGGEEVAVKVRGLYDYTATCDTELSFKEGEIFTVSEQDSSGWWYATIGDKSGFVPENYVQVVQ